MDDRSYIQWFLASCNSGPGGEEMHHMRRSYYRRAPLGRIKSQYKFVGAVVTQTDVIFEGQYGAREHAYEDALFSGYGVEMKVG
jgi:hypothetical protein